MYRMLIRPLLFLLPAERAHEVAMDLLAFLCRYRMTRACVRALWDATRKTDQVECSGLTFPNAVGLAAGFDKDARWVDALACLGFGFIEIGTVTPRPQHGNPRPRLFRLTADRALVNRMGFNNSGSAAAAGRLRKRRSRIPVGGNIGRNKDTPNELARLDYEQCYLDLRDVVDYFVINVSSPNTPGLRALQEGAFLEDLLRSLRALNEDGGPQRPLFLKISPDLADDQIREVVRIVLATGIDGIIATNTTVSREGLLTDQQLVSSIGAGGLSGEPLRRRSLEVLRLIEKESGGRIALIGSGGIGSARDATDKLEAGAKLVQLYTGFIYEGPRLTGSILKAIRLRRAKAS